MPTPANKKEKRGRRFKTLVDEHDYIDIRSVPYRKFEKVYRRLFMRNTRKMKRMTIT